MHRACVPLGLILAATAPATAGGLAIVGGSPRAIGRAGTNTVGDDGGGALLVNPAAIARRDGTRVQIGLAIDDDSIAWDPVDREGPIARDQSGASMLPLVAVVGSVGDWILGAGVMTAGVTDRALRDPLALPANSLGADFGYRYTGIAGNLRRDTATVGVARRIGDAVALGVSLGWSRVTIGETRRMWVGFDQAIQSRKLGDPVRDVEISVAGHDNFVPGAVAGILIAPGDSPIELGASVGWSAQGEIDGDVVARGSLPEAPDVDRLGAPRVQLTSPRARLAVRQPVTLRAGARYLGDRFVLELGGDLWIAPRIARASSWELQGVRVIDPSSADVDLVGMPSRMSLRTHGAIRGALDVELIPGFLWATGGYAYTVGGTTRSRLSTTFSDLGGHTVALGIEGTAGGFTYTIGWSRTFASRRSGGTDFNLDNPFGAGDTSVARGTYDATTDQLGVLLDLELTAPGP